MVLWCLFLPILSLIFIPLVLPDQPIGDLVTFIQNAVFWTTTGCIGAMLVGLEVALSSGKIISARAADVNNARGAKGVAGPAQ